MVKASLKRNETTKQYEWTILDEKNITVIDITTPYKNRLTISNTVYLTFREIDYMARSVFEELTFKDNDRTTLETFLKSYVESNPISRMFQVLFDHKTRKEEFIMFHPVRKCWIHPYEYNVTKLIEIAKSIEIDIVNHVLEFDRQEQMLKCLEHLATRQTIASEMSSIVDDNK